MDIKIGYFQESDSSATGKYLVGFQDFGNASIRSLRAFDNPDEVEAYLNYLHGGQGLPFTMPKT